jgi:hypothetical protein
LIILADDQIRRSRVLHGALCILIADSVLEFTSGGWTDSIASRLLVWLVRAVPETPLAQDLFAVAGEGGMGRECDRKQRGDRRW